MRRSRGALEVALTRPEIDKIIQVRDELMKVGPGRRALGRTARLLGSTVPTIDHLVMGARCRPTTIARMRAALARHADRCMTHTDCEAHPELGRACFAQRSAP